MSEVRGTHYYDITFINLNGEREVVKLKAFSMQEAMFEFKELFNYLQIIGTPKRNG